MWRTGSLIQVAGKKAQIQSNKQIKLSVHKDIKIRLWKQENLEIDGDIVAKVVNILDESRNIFAIEFSEYFSALQPTFQTAK